MKTQEFKFDQSSDMTKIRQIRNRLGLTQKQMADRLSMDLQTYGRWDRGQFAPRVGVIRILKNLAVLTQPLGLNLDTFPDDLL